MQSTCIFATNTVKYHVNRKRARKFAAEARQRLYYAIAEDHASTEVLAEKPHLDEEKVKWLQRHDRGAGDLYGTLPLCVGAPVAVIRATPNQATVACAGHGKRLHPRSSIRSRRVAPGPPSEKPETQGVAETAPSVSALCYHRSRSAGPHHACKKAPPQTSQFEQVTTP